MKTSAAIAALAALAQDTRLAIFRWLVHAHPEAQPAGAIADALGVPPATLSFHLAHLQRAGLIVARRAGRQRLYVVRLETMSTLVRFLLADCCHGAPHGCDDVLDALNATPTV
jgi:ArsR family transcriptional regulator, arsenate/arsenite/antimonite-responsive transcriptional repressor